MEKEVQSLKQNLDKKEKEQITVSSAMEKRLIMQKNELKAQLELKVQEVMNNFQKITDERVLQVFI
jgi:hypothetical protein